MPRTNKPTKITTRQQILDAALHIFSSQGLQGATMEAISQKAHTSKATLFYHFASKELLYTSVLAEVLSAWLSSMEELRSEDAPQKALTAYIKKKYALAQQYPEASRLFALEIINGAPFIKDILNNELKDLVLAKATVIQSWIDAGQLRPIEPLHLIFHIWAITQHYSDFAVQIEAISGKTLNNPALRQSACETTIQLLVNNLLPTE